MVIVKYSCLKMNSDMQTFVWDVSVNFHYFQGPLRYMEDMCEYSTTQCSLYTHAALFPRILCMHMQWRAVQCSQSVCLSCDHFRGR